MQTIVGKYAKARIYAELVEQDAISQIMGMLNQPFTEGSSIAVMPDVHSGKGCTIGTTMTIHDKIVPNLVGVDIGCGVLLTLIDEKGDMDEAELRKLDETIRAYIPSGFDVRDGHWNGGHPDSKAGSDFFGLTGFVETELDELRCAKKVDLKRAKQSIGSLGGGNHYIELDRDSQGRIWLAIHSGSRSLGTGTAAHYQELAVSQRKYEDYGSYNDMVAAIKEQYKDKTKMIGEKIKELRTKATDVPEDLCWLDKSQGPEYDDYIADMETVQRYAVLNRAAMAREIADRMGWKLGESVETVHNYIDIESMILRKGAVSAKAGEKLVIPMNMRDGILICIGKGNADWNCSAPHGAGRLMSRKSAHKNLSMNDFRSAMDGIYTTSVSEDTLDESPMAYKPAESIMAAISDTAEIIETARPIYNFKAAEKPKGMRRK